MSDILLGDLDKELESRGHALRRYAAECDICVRTRRSVERGMASITRFLTVRLKLRGNAARSAVDRPWNRKFPVYFMTHHMRPWLKVAPSVVKRMKDALREEFRLGRRGTLAQVHDSHPCAKALWLAALLQAGGGAGRFR